jgi:hypothetical protein
MVVAAAALLLSACGGDGDGDNPTPPTSAVAAGVAREPTCESVAADAFFQGGGVPAIDASSAGTTACSIEFRGDSKVLAKLGLHSDCGQEASIIVVVDLDPASRRWTYDPAETAEVDNGDCLRGGA